MTTADEGNRRPRRAGSQLRQAQSWTRRKTERSRRELKIADDTTNGGVATSPLRVELDRSIYAEFERVETGDNKHENCHKQGGRRRPAPRIWLSSASINEHDAIGRHRDEGQLSRAEATSHCACTRYTRNYQKRSRFHSSIMATSVITRLLIVSIVTFLMLASDRLIGRSESYQLTNNLIANNLPPKFVNSATSLGGGGGATSEIVVRVKEGPQSIGKLIYTLKGEDPDEDQLTFGVLGTMASELLRVENLPGNQANVYLRKELDRETTESHQVVITLTDGKLGRGNWITKSMLIIVEDVNDNYPVFGPHRTTISIREDAKAPLVIETLEASDADEGRFGQVIYKLDESELQAGSGQTAAASPTNQMFQIDTVDGRAVITLIGQLDYEQRPLYQLRVLAIDRAHENERLSASTSILVSVEDCEDQPPMFTFAPPITRIPEDLPVGSPVVRVTAVDGDRGLNNPIKYALVSVSNQETGFQRNLFSINSDTGQIVVAHELDRELTSASAPAGPSSAAAAATGQSSSQPGAYVLQVRATEVSATSGLLDQLFASSAQSVTTELTVILVDVNDELPTFNQERFFGELLENSPGESLVSFVPGPSGSGQQVAAAKVIDRDQGTNGTFTLHLEGEHGHLFEVWPSEATNEATLMVKVAAGITSADLAKYFDYETNKELRLTLVAREKFPSSSSSSSSHSSRAAPGGRRESSASMVINLRDANDNYPQFDTDLYRVEIPENAIRGMHICAVKATDLDSGPLGSAGVRYTELRGERANKFKLDPVTGVITLRTSEHGFDREQASQHHLIVEARDNLGLGNRNTSQLVVVLADVNDQRPRFMLDQYEAFIYENELDFQSPLQVQATDLDAPNSANSKLTYSIVSGDPQRNFTIDPATGRIRVRANLVPSSPNSANSAETSLDSPVLQATGLDFERIAQKRDESRQFNLTVRASDQGQPEPLASTTQVIVVVYDKNDHAPVFTRPVYARSIREDTQGGSAVVQVQAQDGDHSPTNSRITYRISSGASDKFVIDSDSGLISVANGANLDIDRVQGGGQRRTSYLLNVLASDGSFGANQKSSSALVNISIVDVNNKAPEFVAVGLSTSATSSNQNQAASSQNKQQQQQQQQQQQSVVFVNEDAPYGLIVTRVFATDLDSTAELRFSINYARSEARNEDMQLVESNLYRDVFLIDPTDGTIRVNKQLDRELFDQVKLRLQVEDLAAQTPDQVAYSHLLVRITDINDNRPSFKRPLYKAVVNENSISGTSVITITGDDRDLNKTLKYSLEAASPEMSRLVRINPRSGEVTVNDKIDRELYPLINVTIKAEDFGQPHPLIGSTQLVITVRDENDNNPVFLNSTHTRPPSSPAPPVQPRSDQQPIEPNNHNMNHRQTGQGNNYRLRSLTSPQLGAPQDQPVLDLELGPVSSSTSSWSSSLSPDGSTYANLPPSDENGRELTFLAPGATAQVREDAQVGHQIAYVRAEDADVGNNGRVSFLLDANSNTGGVFRIDRDLGILSVAKQLDRELQSHFTLIIEACDNFDLGYSMGESRRAFTRVHIQVLDVNDNPPSISTGQLIPHRNSTTNPSSTPTSLPTFDEAMNSMGPYELPLAECLYINEFQALNEPILTLLVSDPDDPETQNGQMDLAIINNPVKGELFSLIPMSGAATSQAGNEPVTLTTNLPPPPPPVSSSQFVSVATDLRAAASSLDFQARRQDVQIKRLRRSTETAVTNWPDASQTQNQQQQQQQQQHGSIPGGELRMQLVVSQSLKEKVGNYSILMRATDRNPNQSLSSVKMVNVCVLDVNNNAPVFIRPPLNHTIRVMENATLGSFVAQVEATDLDHGPNGEIQYSLKPTNIQNNNIDWQSFKIDRLSGVITTAKSFNRQLKRYYTLRVQAQDLGRPTSLSSDIDVNIMIVNSGKYQPEFEHQQQALQFTENLAPGVEWFKLMETTNLEDDPALININQQLSTAAANATAWRQAQPCYFIVDGDDHEQVFTLDRYTHKLTNQKELDRERRSSYTLVIQASNSCNSLPPAAATSVRLLSQSTATLAPVGELPATTTASSIGIQVTGIDSGLQSAGSGETRSKRQALVRAQNQTRAPNVGTKRQAKRISNSDKLVTSRTSSAELSLAASQALDALIASDKSLLKVSIKVRDVNDNAPKFTQRVYTGGITTEADFGTVFMIVQAIDADQDVNGQVSYSLVKPIKRNLSLQEAAGLSGNQRLSRPAASGSDATQRRRRSSADDSGENSSTAGNSNELGGSHLEMDGDDLFVINAQTGEISLNFDPQKQMKGYFEFEILAKDPDNLHDSARVLIYLLRQDQRVKFVLRLAPQELRQRLNRFRSVLGNITGALVNIDSFKYYENHDGTVDKKKTSLFLHFVQPEDNTIIEVDKVLTLIDNNIEYLDELYKEFHVLSSEAAHLPLSSGALVDPIDQVRTSLMGAASFLTLILILVIALCINQRTRYERQLKAVAVSAFGGPPLHLDPDFHSTTNLPNTNLHSQDPNPIWINGHHHYAQSASSGCTEVGHWASNITAGNCAKSPSARKLANGRTGSAKAGQHHHQHHHQQQQQQQQQKLFHSASSGIGMALDEEVCEQQRRQRHHHDHLDHLDELSTSGGGAEEDDDNSDLNSLECVNRRANHAGHHFGGGGTTDATATPRDSLNSSHGGQTSTSSSSGANSASTTNERQTLCPSKKQPATGSCRSPSQQQQSSRNPNQSRHNRPSDTPTVQSTANGSTFGRAAGAGAFKEVTIYTDGPKQKPATGSEQNNSIGTSQVNKLASQFNASQLHQVGRPQQQNQRQPIYMSGAANGESQYSQAQRMLQRQQQQKSRISIHSNGTNVEQGIIKTMSTTSNNKKLLINKSDAKLVPPKDTKSPNGLATNISIGQEEPGSNFETSLSKLSILNLETTEL